MVGFDLSVAALGSMAWDELATRVALPAEFPLLAVLRGPTEVSVFLDVRTGGIDPADYGLDPGAIDVTAGRPTVMLRLVAEHQLDAGTPLWGFSIERAIRFEFLAWFLTADAARTALDAAGSRLGGVIRIATRFRLPALPSTGLVTVTTGDPDGWLALQIAGEVSASSGGITGKLSVELSQIGEVALRLPGAAPGEPTLVAALDRITGTIELGTGGAMTATLEGAGHGRLALPASASRFAPLLGASELVAVPDLEVAVGLGFQFAAQGDVGVTFDATVAPSTPRRLALFPLIRAAIDRAGAVIAPDPPPAGYHMTPIPRGDPASLAAIAPRSIKVSARLDRELHVALTAVADAMLLDEGFDIDLELAIDSADGPKLTLLAGRTDPVRLTLQASDLGKLWDGFDAVIGPVVASYGDPDGGIARQLRTTIDKVRAFLAEPDTGIAVAVDLRDLGIVLWPGAPASQRPFVIGGTAELVRLPRFLDPSVLARQAGLAHDPPPLPVVMLSSGITSVSIEIAMPPRRDAAPGDPPAPLIDVHLRDLVAGIHELIGPVAIPTLPDIHIALILRAFRFAYDWSSDVISVGVSGAIDVEPPGAMVKGSGILLPAPSPESPSASLDLNLGTTVSTPPTPSLDWRVLFGNPNDRNNRGLQVVLGIDDGTVRQHVITWWLRQCALAPVDMFALTRFLLAGGVVVGDAPARRRYTGGIALTQDDPAGFALDSHGDRITQDGWFVDIDGNLRTPYGTYVYDRSDTVWAEIELQNLQIFGSLIWIAVGLALEESYGSGTLVMLLSGIVVPFVDEWHFLVNIPGLIYGELLFEMPVPHMSIKAMVELATIVLKKFDVPALPPGSELYDVFYARLQARLRLPLVEQLFGAALHIDGALGLQARLNAGDLLSAALPLLAAAIEKIELAARGAGAVASAISQDPVAALAMIPRAWRGFALDTGMALLGFHCRGSLWLLTPAELHEELVCYFEGVRPGRHGLRGLPELTWDGLPRHGAPPRLGVLRPVKAMPAVADPAKPAAPPTAAPPSDAGKLRPERVQTWTWHAASHVTQRLHPRAGPFAAQRAAALAWARGVWEHKFLPDLTALAATIRKRDADIAAALVAALDRRVSLAAIAAAVNKLGLPPDTIKRLTAAITAPRPFVARARERDKGDKLAAVLAKILDDGGKMTRSDLGPALRPFRSVDDCAFNAAVAEAAHDGSVTAHPKDPPKTRTASKTTSLAAAITAAHRQLNSGLFDLREPQPDQVTWHHALRIRPELVGSPPIVELASFRVPVLGASAAFVVRFRDGGYDVVTTPTSPPVLHLPPKPTRAMLERPRPRPPLRTRLPDALVLRLVGPNRGTTGEAVLRSALYIQEIETRTPRPPRALANVPAADSMLARPEYRLHQLDGGGEISIADLLRVQPGVYHVPHGPALLAGLDVDVLPGLTLHMAGLLAPDLGDPGRSLVLLYASANRSVTLGGVTLGLDGQFWMVHGEGWSDPLARAAPGVYFEGRVTLACGGQRVFDAQGTGTFKTMAGGDQLARLDVKLAWEFDWEAKLRDLGSSVTSASGPPIDLAVGKVWTLGDGGAPGAAAATLAVTLTASATGVKLDAAATGTIRLGYCVLVPRLVKKEVELVPAITIRVWVPPIPFSRDDGHWEEHTSPAITASVYVPDPGGELDPIDPQGVVSFGLDAVTFDLRGDAPPSIRLTLDLSGADWPAGIPHQWPIALPSFLATES
jgi:hypothetical protein